jgi:hypothetical protein
MPDFPQIKPTPKQMEALSVTFFFSQYLSKFAAVVEAEQRRQRGSSIGRKRRARRARGRGDG